MSKDRNIINKLIRILRMYGVDVFKEGSSHGTKSPNLFFTKEDIEQLLSELELTQNNKK